MKLSVPGIAGAMGIGITACSTPLPPAAAITDLAADELPADVRALVERASDGFSIREGQKKVRSGRTYYDVEGELPDGSEIEFDILVTQAGPEIVEIQRDVAWADVPGTVHAAAEAATPGVSPKRVIESRQMDGAIIYELFAQGAPSDPAMEVSLIGGVATVLKERWPH